MQPCCARIAAIQQATADFFDIPLNKITAYQRSRRYSLPRQIAMYLADRLTSHQSKVLAAAFERDRTTVIHGVEVIDSLRSTDEAIAHAVAAITAKLEAGA